MLISQAPRETTAGSGLLYTNVTINFGYSGEDPKHTPQGA